MRIGVVADTHSRKIPKQLLDDFKKVDLIIHAGDFCSEEDLKVFTQLKEVKAVYGNMDEWTLRRLLPRRQIFSIGQFAIGVFHGEGPPQGLLEVVKNEFKKDKIDAVIFGHSHQPFNQTMGHVLYFNPGSPNDTIFAPYCSYGILEEESGKLVGKIIKVKKSDG